MLLDLTPPPPSAASCSSKPASSPPSCCPSRWATVSCPLCCSPASALAPRPAPLRLSSKHAPAFAYLFTDLDPKVQTGCVTPRSTSPAPTSAVLPLPPCSGGSLCHLFFDSLPRPFLVPALSTPTPPSSLFILLAPPHLPSCPHHSLSPRPTRDPRASGPALPPPPWLLSAPHPGEDVPPSAPTSPRYPHRLGVEAHPNPSVPPLGLTGKTAAEADPERGCVPPPPPSPGLLRACFVPVKGRGLRTCC